MRLTYLKTYIFTGVIVSLSCLIQKKLLLSSDVGYLLHAANQLLLGGKYGEAIFETNPPMILYLYIPALLLAKYSAFSIPFAFHLYIYFFCFFSSLLSFYLLKKILTQEDYILKSVLFSIIVFVVFLFPMSSFGQREHLIMILILPYVFNASLRVMDKNIHPGIAFLIGCMGGLGFAIKPYFLPTLCLIELYIIYKKKDVFACARVESLIVLSILSLYLISIFFFQSEYIKIVLPLLFKYYFPYIKVTWGEFFVFKTVPFVVAMILVYPFFLKYDHYPLLGQVLFLCLIGMFMAVLISGAPWFYHMIPAFSFALLLLCYCLGQMFPSIFKKPYKLMDMVFLISASAFTFVYPLWLFCQICKLLLTYYTSDFIVPIKDYFVSKQGDHSITCFALSTINCFPLIYHINGNYNGRFPLFWWLEEIKKLEQISSGIRLSQIEKDKNQFINDIASDLNRYQTRWIILDKSFRKDQENIIAYFSKNAIFKNAFSHYTYRTTIDDQEIYERGNSS